MTDRRADSGPTSVDLSSVRSVETADVYKGTQRAAILTRRAAGVELAYRKDYLASEAEPICGSIPLSTAPYIAPSGAVPAFFAGLLPEGRRLNALRQAIKTSADDEFSLLLAVGADPIGDVSVLPAGSAPTRSDPGLDVQSPIDEVRFTDLLGQVGIVDAVALPGVQDKASVKGMSLPIGHRDHQYILKIGPPEHPNIVLNEAHFLQLARDAGLSTTNFSVVHDVEQRPGLLVQRFDRVPQADGAPTRLECEDACQLLGRWPADKYNLSTEVVANALIARCDAKIIAARDIVAQLVFAWLTGNGDVHTKNISVLRSSDGERRISPAYDLPSTVPYGDITLALPIGGSTSAISRRQWIDLGATLGLREKAATKIIDGLLDATESLASDLASGVLPFNEAVLRAWTKQLRNRRQLLQ